MKKIYAYDFDGTLTSHDSFLAFIRYACGAWAFWLRLKSSMLFVMLSLGIINTCCAP